ncbi:MAG: winged helix-turn-helix domain-containing protein [Planctomycetota bacterium]
MPTERNAIRSPAGAPWTFLTNHSHVLICIGRNPRMRLRDVAERVGITERAVQRIVRELGEAGVLERHREGRNNVYRLNRGAPLRHPLESHHQIGELLDLINRDAVDAKPGAKPVAKKAPA